MFTDKTKTLVVASCVAVIMLSLRVIQSGSFNYIFLAWNIMLAWIPYIVSGWLQETNMKRKWKTNLLLVIWLLFLPNAPYLITDFIHLHKRAGIPLMFDLVMLFLFSFAGLALGLLSVQRTEQWWKLNRPRIPAPRLRIIVFLLCGFGIYLGRVERWNSWDVLANPTELAEEVLYKFTHPFANMYTWGMTVLFAGLLLTAYSIFISSNKNEHHLT